MPNVFADLITLKWSRQNAMVYTDGVMLVSRGEKNSKLDCNYLKEQKL